jgi:hypothetical protein
MIITFLYKLFFEYQEKKKQREKRETLHALAIVLLSLSSHSCSKKRETLLTLALLSLSSQGKTPTSSSHLLRSIKKSIVEILQYNNLFLLSYKISAALWVVQILKMPNFPLPKNGHKHDPGYNLGLINFPKYTPFF